MKDDLDLDLILVITHQLKAPLATNKWSLQEFIEGNYGSITPQQRESLSDIYKNNERAIKLIDSIFNIKNKESHEIKLNKIEVDIRKLIEEVVDDYNTEAIKRKINITFNYPQGRLSPLSIDYDKMRYVFENIIENALRYTRNGGMIKVIVSENKESIIIEVEDNGIGIPSAEQNNIFTKFFRASNAAKITSEGTGFGLFISKNIVERHGGKIRFESKENQGTTFQIALPLDKIL